MLLLASILTLLLFKLISALISVSTQKDFVFFCLFFFYVSVLLPTKSGVTRTSRS